MSSSKDILLGRLRSGESLTGSQQVKLTLLLAVPAILAQLSSVLMQYIDSAMVGRLGSNQAASIGLVSSCTWLFNGFAMAVMTGFTVQVAHACGARDFGKARGLLRREMQMIFQDPMASLNPRKKVSDIIGEGLDIQRRNLRTIFFN